MISSLKQSNLSPIPSDSVAADVKVVSLSIAEANIIKQTIQKGFLRGIFSADEACFICPVYKSITEGIDKKIHSNSKDGPTHVAPKIKQEPQLSPTLGSTTNNQHLQNESPLPPLPHGEDRLGKIFTK